MTPPTSNTDDHTFGLEDDSLIHRIGDLFRGGAQDPATVFPKFDELAGKLISYDRITVSIYFDQWSQMEVSYAAGATLGTYTTGHRTHIQTGDLEI